LDGLFQRAFLAMSHFVELVLPGCRQMRARVRPDCVQAVVQGEYLDDYANPQPCCALWLDQGVLAVVGTFDEVVRLLEAGRRV